MVDNIRDLVDMWLIVMSIGISMWVVGILGLGGAFDRK